MAQRPVAFASSSLARLGSGSSACMSMSNAHLLLPCCWTHYELNARSDTHLLTTAMHLLRGAQAYMRVRLLSRGHSFQNTHPPTHTHIRT
jgi:hypothetical protein